jgi:hypothetical protein
MKTNTHINHSQATIKTNMVNRSQNSIFNIPCSIFDIQSILPLIFDHAGRTVKEVDQGLKSEGMHQQTIDLRNLNPGMYLCSLEANGITSGTQKLLKVQ